MWRKSLAALMLCAVSFTSAHAQSDVSGATNSSLIKAWFSLPGVDGIAWPYAFIRATSTDGSEQAHRADLFEQFDQLKWRLGEDGYPELVAAVEQWKNQLAEVSHYREPGDWSPAWLMAHPYQRPPLARVAAIGYCAVPDTVQIWDSAGVHRVSWRPGMRLSQLLSEDPNLSGGASDEVAVVWPEGGIDHYGVAAWNHADTGLSPGVRVVGAIDLKGAVFPWMRDAIAGLLAHTPAGNECQTRSLDQGAGHD